MRDHRVPLLGDSWRRVPDPERSRDPRVQQVLAGLRELSAGPAPDPAFRAELRAQLVAITPRIVAEGDVETAPRLPERAPRPVRAAAPATASVPASAKAGAGRPSRRRHLGGHLNGGAVSLRRVATAGLCTVVTLCALLAAAVYMSRNTVPGDALYGLKRAAENVQLATDSDAEKPHDLLRFASRRVQEAQTLAARNQASAAGAGVRAAGTVNATAAKQIQDVLASSDSDVRQAARMLGDRAVDSASATPLSTLTSWAPAQLRKLQELRTTLGDRAPVAQRVTSSWKLVSSASQRAVALSRTVHCDCLKSAPSDSLGPKPCVRCSTPAPHHTTAPAVTRSGSAPTHGTTQGGTGHGTRDGSTHGTPPPASGHTATQPAPAHPSPPASTPANPLPGLPTLLPSNPVSIKSCGLTVSVLGLNVSLGSCPTP